MIDFRNPKAAAEAAAVRARYIQDRVKELQASEKTDEMLEELEMWLGECTPKWDAEKKTAIFNGHVNELTTKYFAKMLKEMDGEPFRLDINSWGGNAVDGVAVYNLMSDYEAEIEVVSVGMAYSAASIIFMGGTQRMVATGAIVGIHKASALTYGNSEELLDLVERLETMDELILDVYASQAPKEKMAEIKAAFEKDTELTGTKAVDLGLATGIYKPAKKKKAAPAPAKPPKEEEEKEVKAEQPKQLLASAAAFGVFDLSREITNPVS